jgi:Arm DNA-binding domain
MLEKPARLTERKALALSLPGSGYTLHWCGQTPGFGVRVTAAGARSWVAERRVNGKTVRRTLGKVAGRGAISSDAARKLMIECRRRSKSDPPRRSNIDPGMDADFVMVGCGQV